jgi:hypothetical protein
MLKNEKKSLPLEITCRLSGFKFFQDEYQEIIEIIIIYLNKGKY